MAEIRIGISGWRYEGWRGTFYPKGLPQARELAYASSWMSAIEINGSFYSLQTPSSYRLWRDSVPPDFLFSVKGPRFITHMKRLKDIETPLANFFASGVLALGPKLGPFLWQFPERMRYDPARFEAFFSLLPRSRAAAARLARRHDARVTGRSYVPRATKVGERLRHVIEIRNRTFLDPAFVEQLRRNDIGLVVADTAGKWPYAEDITSDVVYVRLHGDEEIYVSGYTERALERWARRVRAWHEGGEPQDAVRITETRLPSLPRDVFVFFDNDVKVRAPFDAMALARKLGKEREGLLGAA